jgi:predicted ester cyclase
MSKTSDLPALRKDFKAGMSARDAANVMLEKLDGFSIPNSALPAANLVAAGNIHGRLQAQAPPLTEDLRARNIALFYKYIEFENTRDYENLEKLFHPTEFRSTTYFGGDPIAPRALTRMLRGLFRSFPDWYMTVSEIVGADSMGCAGLVTGRGTQVEEFFGRPPADHQVAIPTIHAIRVDADGLIIEHRHSNPFEDVFKAQVMAPQAEDVQAVRAQQGYDSEAARRAYDIALRAGASEKDLAELRARVETGRRMCQTLLKETLRRCSFQAEPGDIYCKLHQTSGYGVDGIDEVVLKVDVRRRTR